VLVRTRLNANVMSQWMRQGISTIDPTLPVTIETMDQRVGKLAERPRFNAALLSLFAAIGLLLALIGTYGVVSFLVAQRTQEIGIRVALGATRNDVLRLVGGASMKPVMIGVVAGLAGALCGSRLLTNLLFGVHPQDPVIYGGMALLLVTVSFLAAFIPVRRATKIEPTVALRYE